VSPDISFNFLGEPMAGTEEKYVYVVRENSDKTEGRGTMIDVGVFDTEDEAFECNRSVSGVMGHPRHFGGADNDGVDHIYYVERVDRPWQDQNGLHVTLLKDGSRRPFKPETPDTNGRNPCLLWILGEVHPWYFDSGWDNVRKITFNHRGSDD
jgi:hypothetical protein